MTHEQVVPMYVYVYNINLFSKQSVVIIRSNEDVKANCKIMRISLPEVD